MNPLGKIYIPLVEKLIKAIFVGDEPVDGALLNKLEGHLKRAQQIKATDYEGHVQSAIGLYHLTTRADHDIVRPYFERARACAIVVDDKALRVRTTNNLAVLAAFCLDVEATVQHCQEVIDLYGSMDMPLVDSGFCYANLLGAYMIMGQWEKVASTLKAFDHLIQNMAVNPTNRTKYGQVVYAYRITSALSYLGLGQYDAVSPQLKLAEELALQLSMPAETNAMLHLTSALYDLALDDEAQAFERWYDQEAANDIAHRYGSAVSVLVKMGYLAAATKLAQYILDQSENEQTRANVYAVFTARGLMLAEAGRSV